MVALDTEFVRERTYYPAAGLIQLQAGAHTLLVDPVRCTELTPLCDLLADPTYLKLVHSGSEDMQVLAALCGIAPEPLFDTQIGAAFCGLGHGLGYHRLVSALIGTELAKDQTRSNWLQRPLSAEQLSYAALDVVHLEEVYSRLNEELDTRGFRAWCDDECNRVNHPSALTQPPEEAFRRIKNANRLKPLEQHRLQALAAWREEHARANDVARNHIAKDAALVDLARRPPRSAGELRTSGVLHPAASRRFGPALLGAVEQLPGPSTEKSATPLLQTLDNERVAAKIPALNEMVQRRATDLDLPPNLLARRRDLEWLAHDPTSELDGTGAPNMLLTGWRLEAVGADLRSLAMDDS